MDTENLTDPRENPFELLLQVDGMATVEETTSERRQRLRGEILMRLEEQLAPPAGRVRLKRLGLHSMDTPQNTQSGEIGIRGIEGTGQLTTAGLDSWQLKMRVSCRLIYRQIADLAERRPERESEASPSESFTGSLALEIELDSDALSETKLRIVSGALVLNRKHEPLGNLLAVKLPLDGSLGFAIDIGATLSLEVTLQPVVFGLAGCLWTGTSWEDQLARAQDVWRKCSIIFKGLPRFESPLNLAHSIKKAEIESAYPREGAIEVYHVASRLSGSTFPRGSSLASVIIPENDQLDDYLLAHELGHVLGLCHPTAEDCTHPVGTYDSILDVTQTPFDPSNSDTNCQRAREPGLELMKSG